MRLYLKSQFIKRRELMHSKCISTRAIGLSIFVAIALAPVASRAQIFALGGEILPDTILKLEDLKAQCIAPTQRAIFEYAKSLKRLEWYRSEQYSDKEEEKLKTLAFGIVQRDTGRPVLRSYIDMRDTVAVTDAQENPYVLSRKSFAGFYWLSKPKPQYSERECVSAAEEWLSIIPSVEKRLPPSFPEVKKYLELAYTNELMGISKRIGSCANVHLSISETYFDAWLSNNFSKSYSRKEAVSRPIYEQLQRELQAFGAAVDAAKKISFVRVSQAECSTLQDAINSYSNRVPAL